MTLELPRLDDRDFQSLVDEAKRLIPTYCPEWTNHNVSDPGVALIEIFAYMTDITLYRVNQLPDRIYSVLLNMMGIERTAANAATADIQFWIAPLEAEKTFTIPKDWKVVSKKGADDTEIMFATSEQVSVAAAEMDAFLTTLDNKTFSENQVKAFGTEGDRVKCFARLQKDDAFYIGMKKSLAGAIIQLDVTVAKAKGTGIDPTRPPIRWEAFTGRWQSCVLLEDTTGGLNREGWVRLQLPDRHENHVLGTHSCFWLRAVLIKGKGELAAEPPAGVAPYTNSPELAELSITTIGVAVPSRHCETIVGPTFLGYSDGTPGQTFTLLPNILRPGPNEDPLLVEVRPPGDAAVGTTPRESDEVRWEAVPDFGSSDSVDRHVVWDHVDGRIRFGPRVPDDNGQPRTFGMIPPKGHEVWVMGYRCGGGAVGNVAEGHLSRLHESLAGVERVRNLRAIGGSDPESVAELKARGPNWLRSGGRAVTGGDYESITEREVELVKRVQAAEPLEPGGPIRLLVIPAGDVDPRELEIDQLAIDGGIVRRVKDALEPIRMIGAEIEVTTPYYQGVSIVARVRKQRGYSGPDLAHAVEAELYRFVDPLKGGWDGEGWPWATELHARNVSEAILNVTGVERVEDIALFEVDLRGGDHHTGERIGSALGVVPLGADSLFLSFQHQVVVDEHG